MPRQSVGFFYSYQSLEDAQSAANAAVAKNGRFVISSDGISLSNLFHQLTSLNLKIN
ncbi:hypothetical protein [Synechococcus sp. ROS8604]|uniref:hypothetical protein n=1 Tax=Synechococcus sp. ROS8604 TaxID=1442557 RepID=UPI001862F23D|nr:hypothetical protein [Synechococcus sp. ROS8604]QNI88320.1 hypothetical protein SynROS8604_01688 [Synechococcus sp. ROS8604]